MWTEQHYRIRIAGALPADWSEWFDGLTLRIDHGDTVIEGAFPNQAALFGVLTRVNSLNLTLISVERMAASAEA